MSVFAGPEIENSSLVFHYDMANPKSWLGAPTTNLFGVDPGLNIYNNVPGDISVGMWSTTEKFRGATVYKQTWTGMSVSGVTNGTFGNNPGRGAYGSYGSHYTYSASARYGASIFFKPTTGLYTPVPMYCTYSNISGWVGGQNVEPVEDGWYRAWTNWYDTTTRADNKYWALNLFTMSVGQPVDCYWAGHFLELSKPLFTANVSPYSLNGRAASGDCLKDLRGGTTIDVTNIQLNADNTFSWTGSAQKYLQIAGTNDVRLSSTTVSTVNIWIKVKSVGANGYVEMYGAFGGTPYLAIKWLPTSIGYASRNQGFYGCDVNMTNNYNEWQMFTVIIDNSANNIKVSKNGVYVGQASFTAGATPTTGDVYIGFWGCTGNTNDGLTGDIPLLQVFNRALTTNEISQLFMSHRRRFGI